MELNDLDATTTDTLEPSQELLGWYDSRKRDLPWRRSQDPYAIWISEIMLQQTQVATVIPYFEAFLRRFPSVERLAEAPIDEVLAQWSGLGYYRRARQLHAAAKQVSATGGSLPGNARDLQQLPGIGPYTSAAIASIAFGETIAVMDGNVERVTARLIALEGDAKKKEIRTRLLEVADGLLDAERPGDSNQALMELGATLCRPTQPACLICPLEGICAGKGEAEKYPSKKVRRRVEKVTLAVALAQDESGAVLFFRRPEQSDLMAGLWELPNVPLVGNEAELGQELGRRYGGDWHLQPTGETVKHSITYRAMTFHLYRAQATYDGNEVAEGTPAVWARADAIPSLAMSSAMKKILAKRSALEG